MITVNVDNYEQEVLKSELPVVVDVWGPQCGPCQALMPKIEAMAQSFAGRIKFAKLNIVENRRLAITLNIMGVPAFLFYKNGQIAERLAGGQADVDSIKNAANRLL